MLQKSVNNDEEQETLRVESLLGGKGLTGRHLKALAPLNPDWAKTGPHMAEIGQLTFSLSPLPLLAHNIVLPSLELNAPAWRTPLAEPATPRSEPAPVGDLAC